MQGKVTITRNSDATYTASWQDDRAVHTATYEMLSDLIGDLADNEVEAGAGFIFGNRLGALAIELSETKLPRSEVVNGLFDTTDPAWEEALTGLIGVLSEVRDTIR